MSLGEINDPIAGWVRWDGSRRETVLDEVGEGKPPTVYGFPP